MRNIFLFLLLFFSVQNIFAQWSDDSLSNLTIKDGSGIEEVVPLQATTADGYTYISWFESNNGNYKMMMQLLDVQGNKLWGDDGLLVSDHPTGSALYVYHLACDHDGNAIVAFQDERNGNLMPVAYKLDQSGNFIWGADGIVLHDSLATFELAPSIGILNDNDVIRRLQRKPSCNSRLNFLQTETAIACDFEECGNQVIKICRGINFRFFI